MPTIVIDSATSVSRLRGLAHTAAMVQPESYYVLLTDDLHPPQLLPASAAIPAAAVTAEPPSTPAACFMLTVPQANHNAKEVSALEAENFVIWKVDPSLNAGSQHLNRTFVLSEADFTGRVGAAAAGPLHHQYVVSSRKRPELNSISGDFQHVSADGKAAPAVVASRAAVSTLKGHDNRFHCAVEIESAPEDALTRDRGARFGDGVYAASPAEKTAVRIVRRPSDAAAPPLLWVLTLDSQTHKVSWQRDLRAEHVTSGGTSPLPAEGTAATHRQYFWLVPLAAMHWDPTRWMTQILVPHLLLSRVGGSDRDDRDPWHLGQVAMLGSHNSGTGHINDDSEMSSDSPVANSNGVVQAVALPTVRKWAKCQPVSVLEQLQDGCRFLDFRIGWNEDKTRPGGGRPWIVHSVFSQPLDDALRDVVKFCRPFSTPRHGTRGPVKGGEWHELIVIDVQHCYTSTPEQDRAVTDAFLWAFGEREEGMPSSADVAPWRPTLICASRDDNEAPVAIPPLARFWGARRDPTSLGTGCVVAFFPESKLSGNAAVGRLGRQVLHSRDRQGAVDSRWPNAQSHDELLSKLKDPANRHSTTAPPRPRNIRVTQGLVTTAAKHIVDNLIVIDGVESLAAKVNDTVVHWFATDEAVTPPATASGSETAPVATVSPVDSSPLLVSESAAARRGHVLLLDWITKPLRYRRAGDKVNDPRNANAEHEPMCSMSAAAICSHLNVPGWRLRDGYLTGRSHAHRYTDLYEQSQAQLSGSAPPA